MKDIAASYSKPIIITSVMTKVPSIFRTYLSSYPDIKSTIQGCSSEDAICIFNVTSDIEGNYAALLHELGHWYPFHTIDETKAWNRAWYRALVITARMTTVRREALATYADAEA